MQKSKREEKPFEASNVFSFTIKVFHFFGLSVWHGGWKYLAYRNFTFMLCVSYVCLESSNLARKLSPFDFHGFTESFGLISINMVGITKYLLLVYHKREYSEIIIFFSENIFEVEREDYREMRRSCYKAHRKFLVAIIALCNFTSGTMIFDTYMNCKNLALPEKIVSPMDLHDRLWLYAILLLSMSWIFMALSNNAANGTLLLSSMMTYTSNEFKILGIGFEESLNELENSKKPNQDECHEKLIKLTKRHQELLRIARTIQDLLFFPMLFEIAMYSLIITLCVFEMISTDNFFSVEFVSRSQLVMCALVDFLIFALNGEDLKRQTEKIRGQIYSCKWYLMKRDDERQLKTYKSVKSLLLVNMMIAEGFTIQAGGLFPLRLETYKDILKFSYSMLAFILQTLPN